MCWEFSHANGAGSKGWRFIRRSFCLALHCGNVGHPMSYVRQSATLPIIQLVFPSLVLLSLYICIISKWVGTAYSHARQLAQVIAASDLCLNLVISPFP